MSDIESVGDEPHEVEEEEEVNDLRTAIRKVGIFVTAGIFAPVGTIAFGCPARTFFLFVAVELLRLGNSVGHTACSTARGTVVGGSYEAADTRPHTQVYVTRLPACMKLTWVKQHNR